MSKFRFLLHSSTKEHGAYEEVLLSLFVGGRCFEAMFKVGHRGVGYNGEHCESLYDKAWAEMYTKAQAEGYLP